MTLFQESVSPSPLDISNQTAKLKQCRALATEITEKGAELYDLISSETKLGVSSFYTGCKKWCFVATAGTWLDRRGDQRIHRKSS
jgi:hypothetical protein